MDDPGFWIWRKDDYREMLEAAPNIQALILTFIETGARVEEQHSDELETDAEKLAAARPIRGKCSRDIFLWHCVVRSPQCGL